jgi:hypothetical protein
MSDTNTVSPLRHRMIEDMAARKLGPQRAARPHLQLQAVHRLAQTHARYGNARRRYADFSCTSSRAGRASATAIGS